MTQYMAPAKTYSPAPLYSLYAKAGIYGDERNLIVSGWTYAGLLSYITLRQWDRKKLEIVEDEDRKLTAILEAMKGE